MSDDTRREFGRTNDLADLPFPRFLLSPPYDHFERVTNPSRLGPERLALATVLTLHVTDPIRDWQLLPEWVPRIRARFPAAPVILWAAQRGDPEFAHVARRAGELHIRAVLGAGEPIYQTLQRVLTQPVALGGDVTEWLVLRGLRLTPDLGYLIEQIFSRAAQYRDVSDLLRELGEPLSTARRRCHKKRLPPPGSWLHGAHALHTAFRIQADDYCSLDSCSLDILAWKLGYGDHSALSRQLLGSFGLRPIHLRGTLGWEWLLERWLVRAMIRVPGAAR